MFLQRNFKFLRNNFQILINQFLNFQRKLHRQKTSRNQPVSKKFALVSKFVPAKSF